MDPNEELIRRAFEASRNAYAPYSRFKVGAALLLGDGEIIPGCNVENASYGLTICAERNALFSAVARGRTDFKKLAIYVGTTEFAASCGACRQVLLELAPDMEIILVNIELKTRLLKVRELLPHAFTSGNLSAGR